MKRFSVLALLGLVIGAMALSAGCASSGGSVKSAGELTGTDWALVGSSLSSSDLGAAKITAAFDADTDERLLRSQPVQRPLHGRPEQRILQGGTSRRDSDGRT